MIWIFDKDPYLCARYYPDEELHLVLKQGIKALCKGTGKWGRWAYKSTQNWLWLYRLVDFIGMEIVSRKPTTGSILYMFSTGAFLEKLWQEMPTLPCNNRGLKTKFPNYGTPKGRLRNLSNKQRIHEYRKQFNAGRPDARWSQPAEEPFWYYGNL